MHNKKLSQIVIGLAIKIHKELGPGLLESVYHACFIHELKKTNITHESEVVIPVRYDSLNIKTGFKADLIIDDKIIIEIKSVEKLLPVHKAQTLTYLKMSQKPLALLINFGETYVKNGIHRFVNGKEGESL